MNIEKLPNLFGNLAKFQEKKVAENEDTKLRKRQQKLKKIMEARKLS